MVRPVESSIRVITDEGVARLLVVPIKRQILRHVSERELTQKMLAERLKVSDPTISYHLDALKAAGLVRIVRQEPESHGILQSFYRATATYFVADYGKMPTDLKRYFLAVNLERLRGVFAVLRALRRVKLSLTSAEMEDLADRVSYSVADVAKGYSARAFDGGRESLIVSLYGDALQRVIKEDPKGMAALSSQLFGLNLKVT